MKVSENWLREWVNPAVDVNQLAALLTMAGLEIDAVSPVAGVFNKVIVAKVIETRAHPQANKLTLCKIDTGSDVLDVVCGASNVRPGLKVALAQVGAELPGDLVIKEAQLRGELSQGMLCSASELGLSDSSEGILELDSDAPIGMDFRQYLSLDDQVLDIDLTPNRSDCLSVLGIAREVSALTATPLNPLAQTNVLPQTDASIAVTLQAPSACSRYCGRVITGINPHATSPLWLRERLRRAGLRSIHPVVDVTNYVMLELGQPMHAFDISKLKGDISVRFGNQHETLTLLDNRQVTLAETILVIADDEKPLAIAGVMGGLDSAVDEETTSVFLESAFFNPVVIAGVARKYAMFTDSAQRFERGVDPFLSRQALERASELLLAIVGGTAGPVTDAMDSVNFPTPKKVTFNPEKVKKLTGLQLEKSRMLAILTGLGMKVDDSQAIWTIDVPTYRFDITLDVDLVEEIVRLHGYDKLVGDTMIANVQAGVINPLESLFVRAGQFFAARGYHETISYSFVDPQLQRVLYSDENNLNLLNPISAELSQMRKGLWAGLLAAMIYNVHRQQSSIKFFETGVIFDQTSGNLVERHCLAGLLHGDYAPVSWNESARKFDFFDLKGDLHAFFNSLQLSGMTFQPESHDALHPGKSAAIYRNGQRIGWCGVLHPRIADAFELQSDVVLFEMELQGISNSQAARYQPISKFPQIRRDLSLLADNKISMAQIELAIKETVDDRLLKSIDVFDVYQGESIPVGKRSLALALILQDAQRTLIDNEINEIIGAILKKLEDKFAITLRD